MYSFKEETGPTACQTIAGKRFIAIRFPTSYPLPLVIYQSANYYNSTLEITTM
jgi:hypothetical protein